MNFLSIIWIHWIADFILQTRTMATSKSTSWKWLSSHVFVYSLPLLLFGWQFAFFNGITHFLTDAVTSRLTSYLWKKQNIHMFFIVIGLDQSIHLTCLYLSWVHLL